VPQHADSGVTGHHALEAARRGAFTAEINPEPTEVANDLDLAIAGRAEVVLDAVERVLSES